MQPSVITIGTFDGMHRGHKEILNVLNAIASDNGLLRKVITFSNHPLSVIAPERKPQWALPREVSLMALKDFADEVIELNFSKELASFTARQFMDMLRDEYGAAMVVMGYDNTFGSDCLKQHSEYEKIAADAGVEVVFVDAVYCEENIPISSSRLRRSIASWNFKDILNCRGEWPMYRGTVVHGRHLGTELGFPTMNVKLPEDIVGIPSGVYAVKYIDTDSHVLPAVMSVGNNPSVKAGNERTIEIHVPNVDLGEMYGRQIEFFVGPKLRDISKFNSLEELKTAINKDISAVPKYIS